MKKGWWGIFDGIERDYEEFWAAYVAHKKLDETKGRVIEEKQRMWDKICRWIDEYSRLMSAVIPEQHITCMVENLQQYRDFSAEDVLHVVENLGKVAHWMYRANYDVFQCDHVFSRDYNHLLGYYVAALRQVVCLTATFVREDSSGSTFTSFRVRLEELFLSEREI